MNADTPKVAAAKTVTGKTDAPASKTAAKKTATKVTPAKQAVAAKPAAKPASKAVVKAADKKVTAVKKIKKETKVKVVRDSFTMPQAEYQQIADIKASCLKAGTHVKKSEVLRAGLKVLSALTAGELKIVLNSLDKIPTGRPKKH